MQLQFQAAVSLPDIIVITGDLIDAQHTDVEIAFCFAQESVKIDPTYYVSGTFIGGIKSGSTIVCGNNFNVDENGKLVCTNAKVNGEIAATSGYFDKEVECRKTLTIIGGSYLGGEFIPDEAVASMTVSGNRYYTTLSVNNDNSSVVLVVNDVCTADPLSGDGISLTGLSSEIQSLKNSVKELQAEVASLKSLING